MLSPREARALCSGTDVESTLRVLRREHIDAGALRKLLAQREDDGEGPRPTVAELVDEHGRTSEAAVHVPAGVPRGRLGALVVLHGAGGSGPQVLPHFTALGDRVGAAVICPTAQVPPRPANGLDLAGPFGKRFARPSWDLRGGDLPLAALRWARSVLDVDPDRCFVAGVSMGGLATWNLGMRFWPRFAGAVPLNGALSMWEVFGTDRRSRTLLPNLRALPVFAVHGSEDEQIPARFDRQSVATLRELGHHDVEYVEVADGQHGLETLGMGPGTPLHRRLAQWLAARRRATCPVAIRHRADEDRHGRAHWVQASGISPRAAAEVRAHRKGPGHVVIDVEHATSVTLHLSSAWVSPGETLRVSVNGETSAVRFEPDLETTVASFRETADPDSTAEQVASFEVPPDTETRDDAAHPIRDPRDAARQGHRTGGDLRAGTAGP
ncbi:MAG TPA: hypothetical protein VGL47_10865 [Amycolatopsis sp.]|uniref:Phospholipase/carboxylesterase/thioesterase domain-containing protein n=1 Tax=Amycolatopsis nalaikhensis TaxID=715472 RepID=A0ABY8XZ94_9PSEU|nr:hypothetical protein [Amycolatopsis sp. 2-2]WIV61043.1 hypothetical protein QP939_21800 [Amycolatopsis sp. 2-2]